MGINQVIEIMGNPPNRIFDSENKSVDTSLRLGFYYYDKGEDTEISIIFNNNLKVVMVGQDD
ncbi:MAG: hypothetical protein R2760_07175 [Chitinophagales bacterium]